MVPALFNVPDRVVDWVYGGPVLDTGERVIEPWLLGVMVIGVPDVMERVPPVKVPWLFGLTKLPLNCMVPVEPSTVPVVETTLLLFTMPTPWPTPA